MNVRARARKQNETKRLISIIMSASQDKIRKQKELSK